MSKDMNDGLPDSPSTEESLFELLGLEAILEMLNALGKYIDELTLHAAIMNNISLQNLLMAQQQGQLLRADGQRRRFSMSDVRAERDDDFEKSPAKIVSKTSANKDPLVLDPKSGLTKPIRIASRAEVGQRVAEMGAPKVQVEEQRYPRRIGIENHRPR